MRRKSGACRAGVEQISMMCRYLVEYSCMELTYIVRNITLIHHGIK